MHACQRESRISGVVELGSVPTRRGVANRAIAREVRLYVVRIRRAVEIIGMTSKTADRSAFGETTHVT